MGGGNFAVQMDLDASNQKTAKLKTKIDIKNFHPSSLPDYKDKFTGAKTDATIDISGSGNSMAAIMAGSNGKFLVQMGAGTFKSSSASAATTDVLSGLKNAIYSGGASSSNDTEINCGVINLNIKDGIATADKGIAINTKKMNIIGSGIINLKTEELDIAIDPQAREGVGISAHWRNPRLFRIPKPHLRLLHRLARLLQPVDCPFWHKVCLILQLQTVTPVQRHWVSSQKKLQLLQIQQLKQKKKNQNPSLKKQLTQ
jgi:hypothetical protein